jgi:two-component sensor histidine kinase
MGCDQAASAFGRTFKLRTSIEGLQIFLQPKLAQVLALIFHEVTTNAAKFGALSQGSDHVSIRCSISRANEYPLLAGRPFPMLIGRPCCISR